MYTVVYFVQYVDTLSFAAMLRIWIRWDPDRFCGIRNGFLLLSDFGVLHIIYIKWKKN